ncbi:serine protease [Dyella tabacisoli]|uniref:Serine protease n=2 Tax=Dyella tabacisoli TaxID=2282381 RepID=A0A369UQP7_9GAMM|nr:serine protease [Dyella tabacisoli]
MRWLERANGRAWVALREAVVLMVGLTAISAVHAASLDAALLPKIQGATFEVVAAKPVNDPLTYEKPLPLDLLPFQERNDKYYSIGTAFAIGHNRYITAGHVLLAGVDSLWGQPSLRDASGHIYAIDKVEKFDLRRDFVVFSLADDPAPSPLEVDTKPVLNQEVYAVGNALGTGVVIRDGLYTSDTPEQQDGAWKWMRFSAAASPGNSGGPLLTKEGKVIGVVLMKSANENLNYALQIGDVLNAPSGQAVMEKRVTYQLDIFSTTLNNHIKSQFTLPLGLADFFNEFQKRFGDYVDTQLKDILAKDADKLFPHGDGSNRLLYGGSWMNTLPGLITRDSTGEWGLSVKEGKVMTLAANGYVETGVLNRTFFLHLRRPDTLPASKLYNDPSALAEQLCKLGLFMRQVGSEQIRITSLGKPLTDTVHTDQWQRRWQLRVWAMPYADTKIVTYSLPVPSGYAIIMRFAMPGQSYDTTADMRTLTDFVSVSYSGTLAQWKDYLQNTALLPAAFKDIHIDIDYQHRFSYASKRLAFAYTPDLQKIEPDSLLTLGAGFLPDHGKVVWDVNTLSMRASKQDGDRLHIERNAVPPNDMDDSFKSYWDKLVKRRHPYESVAYTTDGETNIAAPAGEQAAAPSVLYSVYYVMAGTQQQDTMKTKLDLLLKGLQIKEH